MVCVSVIVKPRHRGGPGLLVAVEPGKGGGEQNCGNFFLKVYGVSGTDL